MSTTYDVIRTAVQDAMMEEPGMPQHVFVDFGENMPADVKEAAERAGCWIRERGRYDDGYYIVVDCL